MRVNPTGTLAVTVFVAVLITQTLLLSLFVTYNLFSIWGYCKVSSNFHIPGWLYPPYQSQEIVSALTANGIDARYEEIRSQYGHDAFLLEEGQLSYMIRSFLSEILVSDVMNRNFYTVSRDETIEHASRLMVKECVSHLPVISEDGKLEGIVTSWDITKAVACKINELNEIITRDVKYVYEDERIEHASSIMEKHSISALPVIDCEKRILGMVTSESISALIGRFS